MSQLDALGSFPRGDVSAKVTIVQCGVITSMFIPLPSQIQITTPIDEEYHHYDEEDDDADDIEDDNDEDEGVKTIKVITIE